MGLKRQIKKFLKICTILGISLYSCKKVENDEIVLELSTSGCYGECPVLDFKLYKQKVVFNLIEFNSVFGIYEYQFSKIERDSLENLFSKIDFENLKNEYTSSMQDIQTFNSVIYRNGTSKKVYFYAEDVPNNFYNLTDFVMKYKDFDGLTKLDTLMKFNTRKDLEVIKDEGSIPLPPPPNGNVVK